MRKKPSLAPLGESELEMLQLVWEIGPASVAEIHQRILQVRQVAYTTVMSALRKLAAKGYHQLG
ncbi:MAG: BlaI/MecI/CopY family transcriptional regulator [Bacteroidota bacterium]